MPGPKLPAVDADFMRIRLCPRDNCATLDTSNRPKTAWPRLERSFKRHLQKKTGLAAPDYADITIS